MQTHQPCGNAKDEYHRNSIGKLLGEGRRAKLSNNPLPGAAEVDLSPPQTAYMKKLNKTKVSKKKAGKTKADVGAAKARAPTSKARNRQPLG